MNEEILKNAQFYLLKQAERIADNIASAKANIDFNARALNNATPIVMRDWGNVYENKIVESKERIKNWQIGIKQIDECVKYLESLVK